MCGIAKLPGPHAADLSWLCAHRYNAPAQGYVGPVTPCTETYGLVPNTSINYEWNNYDRSYRSALPQLPCPRPNSC